jgi:hypothetical protein
MVSCIGIRRISQNSSPRTVWLSDMLSESRPVGTVLGTVLGTCTHVARSSRSRVSSESDRGGYGSGAARMLLGVAVLCATVAYARGQACPSECSASCSLDVLSTGIVEPGKFFNFDLPAGCDILPGDQAQYTVNQYRNDALYWTGDIVVWLDGNDPGTVGSSSGRRHPYDDVDFYQWEAGDRVCVGCASNCPSENGRCGPLFGGCRCPAGQPYCNTDNGWCGGDAHRDAQCGVQYDYGTENVADDCGGGDDDTYVESYTYTSDDPGAGFTSWWLVYLFAFAIPMGFLVYALFCCAKAYDFEKIIPPGPTTFVALPPGK